MSTPRGAASATPSSFADLPLSALQNILERLSLSERLTACALVCQQWSAAAAAASSSITKVLSTEEKQGSFLAWLGRHADSVTSIKLDWEEDATEEAADLLELDQLPCSSSLRDLELGTFCLEPLSGVLADATGLTRLAITGAVLCSQPDAFSAIAALTGLQELTLCDVTAGGPIHIPGDDLAALTQLTKLDLTDAVAHPFYTLQHISRLTRLQDLKHARLFEFGDSDSDPESDSDTEYVYGAASTLAGISRLQLTRLVLFDVAGTLSRQHLLSGDAQQQQPQAAVLSSLQHLDMQNVTFEPALLAGMTQLTYLRLSDLVLVKEGADSVSAAQAATDSLGAYQMLLALPSLQQLRVLRLDIDPWPAAPDQLAAYSALTAASTLQHLDLQERNPPGPLPTAAWKHIFRQELQLPGIAAVSLIGLAPHSIEERVQSCCPTVMADSPARYTDPMLERRRLDPEYDDITPAELRLLEVNADDPPGPPAVLAALTHLEVLFEGRFHGFGIHSCPESVRAEHPEDWTMRSWSGGQRRTLW